MKRPLEQSKPLAKQTPKKNLPPPKKIKIRKYPAHKNPPEIDKTFLKTRMFSSFYYFEGSVLFRSFFCEGDFHIFCTHYRGKNIVFSNFWGGVQLLRAHFWEGKICIELSVFFCEMDFRFIFLFG